MRLLSIVLLASATLAQPTLAQDEAPLFRAGVALVRIDAQVVERNGRPIETLQAADFAVFDEDQPREISYFGREAEPLDLVLLLDVSGSMKRIVREMASVAERSLDQLHEGDRVAVMPFARRHMVRLPFTSDFAGVQMTMLRAVSEGDLGAGTAINEAVIAAAKLLGSESRKGRRAVLIASDNQGLNYQVNDEAVLKELYAADATLNGIVFGRLKREADPKGYVNPDYTPPDIERLAAETGGEAVESRRAGESFETMIDRIRARYALQYAAPAAEPGAFRRVRVELTAAARKRHPNATVRARAGYYAR